MLEVFMTKSNIREKGLVEENTLLLDQGDVVAEPTNVEGLYGIAINVNLTRAYIIIQHEQVANRALAGPTSTDYKCRFACREEETHVVQGKPVWPGRVTETDLPRVSDESTLRD